MENEGIASKALRVLVLALRVELEERNLMSRAPRGSKTPLFGKAQWFTVSFIGLWEGLITLVAFMIGIKVLAAKRLLP